MLALIQRVREARVEVDAVTVGRIGPGLLVLVCAVHGDTPAQADKLVERVLRLRIFNDASGKMNGSLLDLQADWQASAGQADGAAAIDTQPGLMLVSQFTLAANTKSGNRPSFAAAAPGELASSLYRRVLEQAHLRFPRVAAGVFGADMRVSLVNDGPVTLSLET